MTPLDEMAERYHADTAFHAIVDMLRSAIHQLQLSPSEVRNAAMFAVWIEETRNSQPFVVLTRAP